MFLYLTTMATMLVTLLRKIQNQLFSNCMEFLIGKKSIVGEFIVPYKGVIESVSFFMIPVAWEGQHEENVEKNFCPLFSICHMK